MLQPKAHSIKRVRIAEEPERTRLERITTILQAVSAILVPIVVAVAGLIIQESIAKQSAQIQKSAAEQSVAKDYVGIATTILERPKAEGYDALRDWAVDLLKKNTPLEFTQKQLDELKSGGLGLGQGTIDLLNHISSLRQSLRALASSPDGKRLPIIVARPYQKGSYFFGEVYDFLTGKRIFDFGPGYPAFAQPPTLVWSHDSSKLLVGHSIPSGTAQPPSLGYLSAFDAQGKSLGTHEVPGLQSFEFREDDRNVSITTTDGKPAPDWPLP